MMRFVALLAMCAAQAEAFSVPGLCAPSLVCVRPALQVLLRRQRASAYCFYYVQRGALKLCVRLPLLAERARA